jgi:serine/threonine protein kinase
LYIYSIMKRVGTRIQVMNGTAKQTGGGLRKRDLTYNKRGKIVSKKMQLIAKKRMQTGGVKKTRLSGSKVDTKVYSVTYTKEEKHSNFVQKMYIKDNEHGQKIYNSDRVKKEQDVLQVLLDDEKPNLMQKNIVELMAGSKDYILYLEFLKGGDLYDLGNRIYDDSTKLTLTNALMLMITLAKTLQYIHEKEYIHLDIKKENICFRDKIDDYNNYKYDDNTVIIDFESAMSKAEIESRQLSNLFKRNKSTSGAFTPIEMEPHILKYKYSILELKGILGNNYNIHKNIYEGESVEQSLNSWDRAQTIDVYLLGNVFTYIIFIGLDKVDQNKSLKELLGGMLNTNWEQRLKINDIIERLQLEIKLDSEGGEEELTVERQLSDRLIEQSGVQSTFGPLRGQPLPIPWGIPSRPNNKNKLNRAAHNAVSVQRQHNSALTPNQVRLIKRSKLYQNKNARKATQNQLEKTMLRHKSKKPKK